MMLLDSFENLPPLLFITYLVSFIGSEKEL